MLCQSSVFPGRPVRVQPGRDGNRNLAQQTAQGNSRIARLTILTYVAHPSCQTHTESFSDGFFFQSLPFWWQNQGLKSIVESTIRSPRMKKKTKNKKEKTLLFVPWVEIAQRYKDTGSWCNSSYWWNLHHSCIIDSFIQTRWCFCIERRTNADYSFTMIFFLFNPKGIFGVFPLVLWKYWWCHQRPDVSGPGGTVTVRAGGQSTICDVDI